MTLKFFVLTLKATVILTLDNQCTHIPILLPKIDSTLFPGEHKIKFFQLTKPKIKPLLTICVGSLLLAQTCILDGHRVCSDKCILMELAKLGIRLGFETGNVRCEYSQLCRMSDLAVIWQSSVHFVCSCGHQTDG